MKKVTIRFSIVSRGSIFRAIAGIVIIGIVMQLTGCSARELLADDNPPATSTPAPLNHGSEIVLVSTGDSEFAKALVFPEGEVLVAQTEIDDTGSVTAVSGAAFVAGEGHRMFMEFEDGLPTRAVVQGYVVEMSNARETTADITIWAPDGTVTVDRNVPFDQSKILYPGNHAALPRDESGKLARPHLTVLGNGSSDTDWMLFASTALGAFSCAATVASGGTLTLIFGAGCALFAYTSYLNATGQDAAIVVSGAGTAASTINCGQGLGNKNPIGVADCAKLIVDVANEISDASTSLVQTIRRPSVQPSGGQRTTSFMFEGAAQYEDSTSICGSSGSHSTTMVAELNQSDNGTLSGALYFKERPDHLIPLAGSSTGIVGEFSGPTSCDAVYTESVSAQMVGDRVLVGSLSVTFTPGTCSMDNCGGTWSFELDRR